MADQDRLIYRQLRTEIERHNALYFEKSAPEIDDNAYDRLVARIRQIEQEHPDWIDAHSPTQRVGERTTDGFEQVGHRSPMLSFDKVFNRTELLAFDLRLRKELQQEVTYSVEAKLDGCAVSVWYRDGCLQRAVTRGNGKMGDDVTANLLTIDTLPRQLKAVGVPKFLEIRGEVFMRESVFKTINRQRREEGLAIYANPRNLASGTLKMLNYKQVAKRELSVLFYAVAEESSRSILTFAGAREMMRNWGLPVLEFAQTVKGIDLVCQEIDKLSHLRSALDFGIDGAVIKVDHLATGIDLGFTGQYYRWGIAYKFTAEKALTQILQIELQMGRTGAIIPVACLAPVELAGTKVCRATLHNMGEIERKDIRIGDFVFLEKGGDIIPKVTEVVLEKRPLQAVIWQPPLNCPFCQTHLVREQVHLRCCNLNCKDQLLARLRHFVSKACMDIDGLGEKVLKLLITQLAVDSPAQLYSLSKVDLLSLPGFAERSAEALLSAIRQSKIRPLGQFLNALGIPHVGKVAAENLARHFESLEKLQRADLLSLQRVNGVGEKMAHAIHEFFTDEFGKKMIGDLLAAGAQPRASLPSAKFADHPFRGKRLAVTGALDLWNRHELERFIEERGGTVTASLSKNVDFLVVGKNPGSKLVKANKWQIAQIYEHQLVSEFQSDEN